jgi:two-component system, OmpR family, phosphate regulon sensor histidine kinase PhoR
MNKPLKKIILILTLIILLPSLIFISYQVMTINESEKVLQSIYENQLDAVIFSVNQYSEDVASSWRNEINSSIKNIIEKDSLKSRIEDLINIHPSLIAVFMADTPSYENIQIFSAKNVTPTNSFSKNISTSLNENQDKIRRLYTYQRGGYNKIEPFSHSSSDSTEVLGFIIEEGIQEFRIGGMVIQKESFIKQVLAPKINSILEGDFAAAVYNPNTGKQVFNPSGLSSDQLKQNKQLWLLKNYHIGIALTGGDIEKVIKDRSMINLALIIFLGLTLIVGIIFVFTNIKKEIELAQIKSDFVSNVSHELRTPLALINMFAETLEMGRVKTEEKKMEYYSIISQETGRLSRIVNKILNFSQIEAGKRKYHFEQTDINSVVEKVYSTYHFHLTSSGFSFSFLPDETIPKINADPEAVSEAVINLIDNGVKYSKDKKEIIIKTGESDGVVFIEVEDKGIGISSENHEKIFEKFFRVSSGDVHNTKGTGLGLTIVQHIAAAHSGKISLESKENEGSIFRLSIPIKGGN